MTRMGQKSPMTRTGQVGLKTRTTQTNPMTKIGQAGPKTQMGWDGLAQRLGPVVLDDLYELGRLDDPDGSSGPDNLMDRAGSMTWTG